MNDGIRISYQELVTEFAVSNRVLRNRLHKYRVKLGTDNKYRLSEACLALFGNESEEKLRLISEQADIAGLKKENLAKESIPAAIVFYVWDAIVTELRQKIDYSKLTEAEKNELKRDLVNVDAAEYFTRAAKVMDETGEENPEPVGTVAAAEHLAMG